MSNMYISLSDMKKMVHDFVQEREWGQFHNPKNLSVNIAVEAAELMELFLWCTTEKAFDEARKRCSDVEDELADVLIGIIAFANATGIDIAHAFTQKLEKTKKKYPVDAVRGRADKYTHYTELKKR